MKLPLFSKSTAPGAVIGDSRVAAVLEGLHGAASGQKLQIVRTFGGALLGRKRLSWQDLAERARDLYLPLSPQQGELCYLLARSIGARRIVEFGTSLGVSTIYLAAAVRDNGGGLVTGTELVVDKARRARQHLDEAGLAAFAEVREATRSRPCATSTSRSTCSCSTAGRTATCPRSSCSARTSAAAAW